MTLSNPPDIASSHVCFNSAVRSSSISEAPVPIPAASGGRTGEAGAARAVNAPPASGRPRGPRTLMALLPGARGRRCPAGPDVTFVDGWQDIEL
mmetsp:Transcript_51814/g.150510  ORF Transcript_51814/g.150510 Transcript_51814/m.150510 type:complete len:94 (-) Transcript_51814:37-318(-)